MEPSVGETQFRYYGWVVVVVAFFLFSLCFGGLVLVGVLIKPWADTFGWQRGEISGAYLIATLSLATGGVAFGRLLFLLTPCRNLNGTRAGLFDTLARCPVIMTRSHNGKLI